MSTPIAERLTPHLFERGARWALLCGEEALCWSAGIDIEIEAGPSPFRGGPPLLVVPETGTPVAVLADVEAVLADTDIRVFTYRGFSIDASEVPSSNYVTAFLSALDTANVAGPVGAELHLLPANIVSALERRGHEVVDISSDLTHLRAIKTGDEIARLRRSATVAAIAQQAAVRAAHAGMSELALFSALRLAAEEHVGGRLAFTGDLVSGVERTAAVGGWPTGRTIAPGEPIITDLAPRVGGYWADSCNTFTVGRASSALRRMHDKVAAALRLAERVAVPGVPVMEIDASVRRLLAKDDLSYPHHTGHSIGTSVHEWPRIIPGEPATLRAGMVILLEPGAYVSGVGGVRLERMYLVTPDGLVNLTDFDQQLDGC